MHTQYYWHDLDRVIAKSNPRDCKMTFNVSRFCAELQILKKWKWPNWVEYCDEICTLILTRCSPRDRQMSFGIGRDFAEFKFWKKKKKKKKKKKNSETGPISGNFLNILYTHYYWRELDRGIAKKICVYNWQKLQATSLKNEYYIHKSWLVIVLQTVLYAFLFCRVYYFHLTRILPKYLNFAANQDFSDCGLIESGSIKTEPHHDKTNKRLVHPANTDQSHRCPYDEALGLWLPIKCTAKTGQTGRMCRLIWVFSGRTCQFVGFVVLWTKWCTRWSKLNP